MGRPQRSSAAVQGPNTFAGTCRIHSRARWRAPSWLMGTACLAAAGWLPPSPIARRAHRSPITSTSTSECARRRESPRLTANQREVFRGSPFSTPFDPCSTPSWLASFWARPCWGCWCSGGGPVDTPWQQPRHPRGRDRPDRPPAVALHSPASRLGASHHQGFPDGCAGLQLCRQPQQEAGGDGGGAARGGRLGDIPQRPSEHPSPLLPNPPWLSP